MTSAALAHLLAGLPQDQAELVVRLSDCYREAGSILGQLGEAVPQFAAGPIVLPGLPDYNALMAGPVAEPPTPVTVTELTFCELMTRNLDDIHKTTKKAGHHGIECHTRMWIALWGDRPAMSVKRAEVEQWALARAQSHSQSTVLHELQVIQRAYNLAVYHEWLPRNPIKGPRLKLKMGRRHQVLSEEDEAKLAAAYAAARKPGQPNLWEIEEFAILTGVRIGEQVRLEVGHVQGKLLHVPEDGKTGTRMVPLCKRAREIASTFASSAKWLFWSWSKQNDRLVVGDSHVKHHWRKRCKEAGIEGYQRRDLRRTFASRLIKKGVSIFEVQKLLGHTDTKTTQIYARVGMDQLSEAVGVFDDDDDEE